MYIIWGKNWVSPSLIHCSYSQHKLTLFWTICTRPYDIPCPRGNQFCKTNMCVCASVCMLTFGSGENIVPAADVNHPYVGVLHTLVCLKLHNRTLTVELYIYVGRVNQIIAFHNQTNEQMCLCRCVDCMCSSTCIYLSVCIKLLILPSRTRLPLAELMSFHVYTTRCVDIIYIKSLMRWLLLV